MDCTAWPYSDRINYQNDKYSHSRFQILHQHCSTQLIFSSLDLKGTLESPNSVISVSQMNFVAPFSPHHQLKYLCNKTNLNVKQVWYFTPPPARNHTSFVPLFLDVPPPPLSLSPSLTLSPSFSHTLSLLPLTPVETE